MSFTEYEQVAVEPRHPDRWLSVIRIVVGLWFLKSVQTKLAASFLFGFIPVPTASDRWLDFMPGRVSEYAQTVGLEGYREFLMDVVVSNGAVFAHLTAFGEAAVGLGLTFGLATRPAALVGLLVMTNYLLATFGVGYCQQGFHLLLVTCMLAFLVSSAGRTWGVDGWWLRRNPGSRLARSGLL